MIISLRFELVSRQDLEMHDKRLNGFARSICAFGRDEFFRSPSYSVQRNEKFATAN